MRQFLYCDPAWWFKICWDLEKITEKLYQNQLILLEDLYHIPHFIVYIYIRFFNELEYTFTKHNHPFSESHCQGCMEVMRQGDHTIAFFATHLKLLCI